jgi:hypothetical protein
VLVGAVALFALAGLVATYAVWSYANVQITVQEALDAGQLALPGSEYDIASFVMSSSVQYGILAVILAGLGWLLLRSGPLTGPAPTREAAASVPRERDDEDLDNLLSGMADGQTP